MSKQYVEGVLKWTKAYSVMYSKIVTGQETKSLLFIKTAGTEGENNFLILSDDNPKGNNNLFSP